MGPMRRPGFPGSADPDAGTVFDSSWSKARIDLGFFVFTVPSVVIHGGVSGTAPARTGRSIR